MEMRPGMDFRDGGGVIENLGDGSNSIIIGTDLIENFDSSDDFQGWFPFLDKRSVVVVGAVLLAPLAVGIGVDAGATWEGQILHLWLEAIREIHTLGGQVVGDGHGVVLDSHASMAATRSLRTLRYSPMWFACRWRRSHSSGGTMGNASE